MNRVFEYAEQILATAEAAAARGDECSEMTIVIGEDGGIHMLADFDWPLESLVLHHGARAAYRVIQESSTVRVEAHELGGHHILVRQTSFRRSQHAAKVQQLLP